MKSPFTDQPCHDMSHPFRGGSSLYQILHVKILFTMISTRTGRITIRPRQRRMDNDVEFEQLGARTAMEANEPQSFRPWLGTLLCLLPAWLLFLQ
jgi:hypothetical protein